MTFASRRASKENLRLRNDSSNEFLTRSNVNQQRVSHSFCRAPRSLQKRSPTSLTLVPTISVLVPNSPPTSLTLVSTSFALAPDSQLTIAIDRRQATTVLSEHHTKDQRKRTQRRSATMFAVFLLCVLRPTLRSRSNQTMGCAHTWMSGRAYESSLSMSRLVYKLKTSAVLWQCGWCVAQTLLLTKVAKTTSTWCLSALPTAQEVSGQHFEKQFVLALRDPHLLWYTPPNSLPIGLPSSPAQARHSDLCTNYKQF